MTSTAFLDPSAVLSAHWTFTTRRVARHHVAGLSSMFDEARSGDLVLCEITTIGQHRRLQLTSKRYKKSYQGDLIVACVGDRYAPDQFEGRAEISADGADLLAGGGVVGTMEHAHQRMAKPTQVRPIGLLTDETGAVINVERYGLAKQAVSDDLTVIGVFGASMNAGKTTAAAALAAGLHRAGFAVAGAKLTGTGSFGDFLAFEDTGVTTLDFTDAGLASTYRMPLERIEESFSVLLGEASRRGAQILIAEIADGVFQRETAAILQRSAIRERMDGLLFAAPDALGSVGGARILAEHGLTPFAISGMVTCSPLSVQEATNATGLAHLTRDELSDPQTIAACVRPLLRQARRASSIAA